MDPASIRVHAPTSVVFLCGGQIDETLAAPLVLRDAFYRSAKGAGVDYKIVLAEDANPLTADAGYKDLLSFESDIAQVVSLILLFAESAGSLAELGSFAALEAIAPSLLAVLDDFFYGQTSFIRNGPVKYLEERHGEQSVHVLDRGHMGIDGDGKIGGLNLANFSASILPAVDERIAAIPEWRKLDRNNSGHGILVMVGLCAEYGALTKTEIRSFMQNLNINIDRYDNYLYCAELLGWLKKVRKGNSIYIVYTGGAVKVIDYSIKKPVDNPDKVNRDKSRWRLDIRSHWANADPARLRAIAEANPVRVP